MKGTYCDSKFDKLLVIQSLVMPSDFEIEFWNRLNFMKSKSLVHCVLNCIYISLTRWFYFLRI